MMIHALLIGLMLVLATAPAGAASALTLQEALAEARENLPSYQAARKKIESADALYEATFGAYLPTLDASAAHSRHDGERSGYSATGYDVTLSYRLFDAKRAATRDIAAFNLETQREELRKNLLELDYRVKVSFYTAVAGREVLAQRKIQVEDAQKDLQVAEGRRSLGAARLSEVLQASVRLEQARFNLVQAEGNLQKALAELCSLIGRADETDAALLGSLDAGSDAPAIQPFTAALLRRPEIRQAEIALEKAESSRRLARGEFYPTVSATLSYSRSDAASFGNQALEDRSAGITAVWNLFELGKFYRTKSARIEVAISADNIRELKRQLLLDCRKAWEDLVTALRNETVGREQLRRAEQNYDQAFGEYKVGKGDILSLVQAESMLANAREQLTGARLNAVLARTLLERIAGIE